MSLKNLKKVIVIALKTPEREQAYREKLEQTAKVAQKFILCGGSPNKALKTLLEHRGTCPGMELHTDRHVAFKYAPGNSNSFIEDAARIADNYSVFIV